MRYSGDGLPKYRTHAEQHALATMKTLRDWHQTLSWKLGYRRGRAGRTYSCPWWADERVYALAFMQGLKSRDTNSDLPE